MTTTDAHDEGRRRRGAVVLLVGAAALLLLGLLGGYVLFGGQGSSAQPLGVRSPSAVAVQPTPAAVTRPPVVVTGTGQSVGRGSAAGTGRGAGSEGGGALGVTARVVGQVAPGTPATLVLTLTNRGPRDLVVTAVVADVTSVSGGGDTKKPACSVGWYRIAPFSGPATVPARGSSAVQLAVTLENLPAVNQDNCKGAAYAYSFSASARQA